MRIIIIDDDINKIENLKRYLSENDTLTSFDNYCSGMRELIFNNNYDLLFLDMNFPICEGEDIAPQMGLAVLSEMKRKKVTTPVVIFSSDIIDISKYDNLVVEYIKYNPSVYFRPQVDDAKAKCLKR